MAIKRITRGSRWPRLVWGFAGVAFAGLIFFSLPSGSLVTSSARAEDSQLKAEDVKTLQTQYLAERSRAEAAGWLKKFSPELTEQTDQLALKGERALAAGRISSARRLLLEARRLLLAPPLDFPV